MSDRLEPFAVRLKFALTLGLWMGGAYSAIVVVLWVVRGGHLSVGGVPLPLLPLIASYLFSGLLGGIVFAILGPLVVGYVSAAVVGFLVVLPATVVFVPITGIAGPWTSSERLIVSIGAAFLLGGGVAVRLYHDGA
jgi:hypothetical protein